MGNINIPNIFTHKAAYTAFFGLGYAGLTLLAGLVLGSLYATHNIALREWVRHGVEIGGQNLGERWMWFGGAGILASIIGTAGLIIHFRKSKKEEVVIKLDSASIATTTPPSPVEASTDRSLPPEQPISTMPPSPVEAPTDRSLPSEQHIFEPFVSWIFQFRPS